MPKHYTVKKAMAGTKTASEERMLAKNMGAKKMPGGGHTKNMPGGGKAKAPMYMMGGKVFEGAMGLMTALAKKNPKDFKKIAEGIK